MLTLLDIADFGRGPDKQPRKRRRASDFLRPAVTVGASIGAAEGAISGYRNYKKNKKSIKSQQTRALRNQYVENQQRGNKYIKSLIENEFKEPVATNINAGSAIQKATSKSKGEVGTQDAQERVYKAVTNLSNEMKGIQKQGRKALNKGNKVARDTSIAYGASRGLNRGVAIGLGAGLAGYGTYRGIEAIKNRKKRLK